MSTPTDVLREEHAVILRGLEVLEAAAEQAEAGADPPDAWWAGALAWLGLFADRNHHGKEEMALFPAMIKAGAPAEGGPIDVMLEEHDEGRALLRSMAERRATERARAARRYVELLRAHIDKEQGIVFPLAEAVLDGPAVEWVGHEFAGMEAAAGVSLSGAEAALDRLRATLAAPAAR